jgi:hypothetical protein
VHQRVADLVRENAADLNVLVHEAKEELGCVGRAFHFIGTVVEFVLQQQALLSEQF